MTSTGAMDLNVRDIFTTALGEQSIVTDDQELEYLSQDYFRLGPTALCAIRPKNIDALTTAVRLATDNGLAIYPRGAGYSYTDGYLHTKPGITIDMRSMSRVLDINSTDMYVTVEAGCTWADLDAALKPHNVRVPFWGPLSGKHATIGGGVSQGAASLGSSKYGLSSDSVLSLEAVSANGDIIRTGSLGQTESSPFFRNYGPDVTGLFCGDCGALGIKAHVTLRLVQRPTEAVGLSYGFNTFEDMAEASAAAAREGLASESFGMPASYALTASQTTGLFEDLSLLLKIGKTGSNVVTGLGRMAKVALSGRRFLNDLQQTWHWVLEGPNGQNVNSQITALRKAIGTRGKELPNTIPMAMRADPFLDYDLVSPTGQRQLPPSTILPFSQVLPFHIEFTNRVKKYSDEMASHNMQVVPVFATVSTNGFLYEPVISWDDVPDCFHIAHSSEPTLQKSKSFQDNPQGRELAGQVRDVMIEVASRHGGIHLQIGKVYPFAKSRNKAHLTVLHQIKKTMDPPGLINPGALQL